MEHKEQYDRIVIPDEDGKEHQFTVIYQFEIDETDSTYIAIVPTEQEELEEQELYVLRIEEDPDGGDLHWYQIEDDEEWDLIEETLATLEADGII